VTLDTLKDLAIIGAGVMALTTFFSGVVEYARQNHTKRAEQFVLMRRRFLEDPLFREILNGLPSDDPKLATFPIQDRRNFLGFLEEVALMVNSRIIRREIAHYMFGYYVLLADKSQNIWTDLDRESVYWTVFRNFATLMRKMGPAPADDLRF
jgi:hypothetical protein